MLQEVRESLVACSCQLYAKTDSHQGIIDFMTSINAATHSLPFPSISAFSRSTLVLLIQCESKT